MSARIGVGAALVLALASSASAGEVIFVLRNGRRVQGEIESETPQVYVVKRSGGRIDVARSSVVRIEEPPRESRYLRPDAPAARKDETPAIAAVATPAPVASPAPPSSAAAVPGKDEARVLLAMLESDAARRAAWEGILDRVPRGEPALARSLAAIAAVREAPGALRRECLKRIADAPALDAVPELAPLFEDEPVADDALAAVLACFPGRAPASAEGGARPAAPPEVWMKAAKSVRATVRSQLAAAAARGARVFAHVVATADAERVESLVDVVSPACEVVAWMHGLLLRAAHGTLDERVLARALWNLSSNDASVRATAAALAGRAKNRDQIPTLIEMLDDADEPCRLAAVRALREISGLKHATKAEWVAWWSSAEPAR